MVRNIMINISEQDKILYDDLRDFLLQYGYINTEQYKQVIYEPISDVDLRIKIGLDRVYYTKGINALRYLNFTSSVYESKYYDIDEDFKRYLIHKNRITVINKLTE